MQVPLKISRFLFICRAGIRPAHLVFWQLPLSRVCSGGLESRYPARTDLHPLFLKVWAARKTASWLQEKAHYLLFSHSLTCHSALRELHIPKKMV